MSIMILAPFLVSAALLTCFQFPFFAVWTGISSPEKEGNCSFLREYVVVGWILAVVLPLLLELQLLISVVFKLYCDLITFWHVTKLQVLWGLSEWRAHLIWANLFIPERFGVTSVQSHSSLETSLRRLKAKEKSLQETAFCRCQNTWTQGWVTAAVKVVCLWFKSLTKYFMKKKQWLGAYWIYINRSALQY